MVSSGTWKLGVVVASLTVAVTAVDGKALRRLPRGSEWVEAWGPIDRGLESASDVAGDRDFRVHLSFDPKTGVPRSRHRRRREKAWADDPVSGPNP